MVYINHTFYSFYLYKLAESVSLVNFKVGDKVRKLYGEETGVVIEGTPEHRLHYGIFKVCVQFPGLILPSYMTKKDLKLVVEPNDIIKEII